MRLKKILLLLALNIFIYNAFAQNKLINPLDGKLLLSANYGELRSMHFHSGVDLKVGGVPGAKIYAVDDAYVYRLSVSPSGYGNGVYLKHSNGNISVYGHLHQFGATLAKFIKAEQYKRNSFVIDTTFSEPVFTVKRGEIIGFAGNSGSSFGAHLHFEIRDSLNVPLNPIAKFYNVADKTPPTIKSLTVFTFDDLENVRFTRTVKDILLKNVKGKHNISETIEIESPAFFGVEAFDNVDETYNKLGVRKIAVTLDNAEIFSCYLDSIGFEKDRYINSFQAYNLLLNENRNVMKTYIERGNKLNKYQNVVNSGIVEISDSLTHKISITLEDDYKNKSILNFNVKAKKKSAENYISTADKKGRRIAWNTGDTIIYSGACIIVQPETFYDNAYIEFEKSDTVITDFSSVYSVNLNSMPLHKSLDIIVKAKVAEKLRDKIMLGGLRNGKIFAVDAQYLMGFAKAKISSSANYFVTVDTVSPRITPKFKDGADLRKQTNLKITIADNLSGIQKYAGYIDDKWALFEYDAKNNLLTYTFDSEHIARNKKHTLKLIVSDKKNNTAVFESSFLW
ncbi:MAG: M23 family metallopeptidase [Prevotellaceae bacterium]|jgi:hypothetical protein|nr:M23 family metallopeptidase [Prevotellaceae bacterium]